MSSILDSELNEAIRSLTELDIEVVGMSNEEIIQIYKQSMNTEETDDYNEILTNNIDNSNTLNINEVNINDDIEDLKATLQSSVQLSSKDADLISSHDNHNTYRDELSPTQAIENFPNVLGTTLGIATNFLEVANWECESVIQLYFESNDTIPDANEGNAIKDNATKHIIKTTPKYKNKDDNSIPIAISVVNDSSNSTEDDTNRNITQNQKYSVTIPNDVIGGDLIVILVDNEEMIVNCREGKKSGDTIVISEDELIPQYYEYIVPEDIVIGEEYTILINNKEIFYIWNAANRPGQTCLVSLPRKKKTRNPDDDIEKIKNIGKYGEMLCDYAKNGNFTSIRSLCDREDIRTFINYQDNKNGKSALSYSCTRGYKDIVSLLISHGADVNVVENNLLTPLYTAVIHSHREIVSLLISEGADVNKRNRDGKSPLYEASYNGHSDLVDMLIDCGADVNSKDIHGVVPLHAASQNGHMEIVRRLISSGAKVSWKTRNGLSPLIAARDTNHKEVVEVLTQAEAVEAKINEIELEVLIEKRNRRHLEEALKRGKQKWNRSKIMIVGDGRAGKTALTRSMMGEPFGDTPSTAGISNITCDVKYASIEGECGEWVLYDKPEKELESSLARMIAAQQQQEEKMTRQQELSETDTPVAINNRGLKNSIERPYDGSKLFAPSALPPHESKSIKVDVDDALVMKYLGEIKSSKLTLSIFDYGGQEVFNTIHHLFLTRLGVYIVVFNMEELVSDDEHIRESCLNNINMWVNSVVVHTYDKNTNKIAPIILVGTRKDTIGEVSAHMKISALLENRLARNRLAWPLIQKLRKTQNLCFLPVDNTKGRVDEMIVVLMNMIENIVMLSDYANKEFPLSWLGVLDSLFKSNSSFMTLLDVARTCSFLNVPIDEAHSMLSLFNQMGILMWHEEDSLRGVIILDAIKYFVDPLAIVICNHRISNANNFLFHDCVVHEYCRDNYYEEYNRMVRNGVVTDHLLTILLQSCGDQISQVIKLMLKFGLIVGIGDSSLENGEYIIPSLLPSEIDRSITNSWTCREQVFYIFFSTTASVVEKNWFSYVEFTELGFLPRGLYERLICKLIMWCKLSSLNRWNDLTLFKNFVNLKFNNHWFSLRSIPQRNSIEIRVKNGNPQIYDRIVEMVLEIIKEFLQSLLVVVCIPIYNATDGREWYVSINSILLSISQERGLADPFDENLILSYAELKDKYSFLKNDIYLTYRGCNPQVTLWEKLCLNLENNPFVATTKLVGKNIRNLDDDDVVAIRHARLIIPVLTTDFLDFFRSENEDCINYNLLEWILCIIFSEKSKFKTKIFPLLLFVSPEMFRLDMIPDVHPRATMDACTKILQRYGINSPYRLSTWTARNIVERLLNRVHYCQWDCPIDISLDYDICRMLEELEYLNIR